MYFIAILICIGTACLIANAAYFAVFKDQRIQKAASVFTPLERLQRAYRSAYFMHVSLTNEVENENGGSAGAH